MLVPVPACRKNDALESSLIALIVAGDRLGACVFLSDEAFLHVARTIPRVSGLGNAQVSSFMHAGLFKWKRFGKCRAPSPDSRCY